VVDLYVDQKHVLSQSMISGKEAVMTQAVTMHLL